MIAKDWIALGACAALFACATTPATPVSTVPSQLGQSPEVGPGRGLLIVDVTDGPTRVEAATDRASACTTPCALALPLGSQALTLRYRDARGSEHFDSTTPLILAEPQVLRRTLRRQVVDKPIRHEVAFVSYALGSLALLTSLLTWAIAPSDNLAARAAARGLAGGGGAMLLLSFPLSIGASHRSTGAEVQFPLESAGTLSAPSSR